jgi:SdrD B-like protein
VFFRRAVAATALAMLAAAAAALLPPAPPAAATSNECTWYTDQDIADTYSPSCRDTFLVDVGVGNLMNRRQLLDAADYYRAQGFDRQWLWYAPMTTVYIPDTSTQLWTGCPSSLPRVAGNACAVPPETHLMLNGGALKATSISLRTFAFDHRAIVRACGNFLKPSAGSNPVPTALLEKYDDRNRNGMRDPGEAGLAGWQFRVERVTSTFTDQDPGVIDTVTTDADGYVRFAFNGAGPGTYAVEEIGQDGWAPTTAARQTFVVGDGVGSGEVAHLRFGNAQTRADLAKVDFGLVDPPTRLDAHTTTELTVRAEVHNNGPADVAATDAIDVTVPDDCLAEPAHDEASRTLVAGDSAVLEFRVRLTCQLPSYHPATFTDHLAVTTPGVSDPVLENNTKAFQQVFQVYDKADVRLADTAVACPARADVGETFECVVTARVSDAGPYGPVTVDVTVGLQPPADCRAEDTGGGHQTLTLPAGSAQTVTSRWRVTCGQRSYHDVTASAEAVLNHLHVEDPVGDNATGTAATRTEIFEPADLAASVVDLRCGEREANTTASSCTAMLVIANAGPATHVAVLATLSIKPEPDCTASPAEPQQTRLVLDAGASATVPAIWQLACTQNHRHSVRVRACIEVGVRKSGVSVVDTR